MDNKQKSLVGRRYPPSSPRPEGGENRGWRGRPLAARANPCRFLITLYGREEGFVGRFVAAHKTLFTQRAADPLEREGCTNRAGIPYTKSETKVNRSTSTSP